MLQAALYGALASSALLLGALIGLFATPPRRVVASVTAFGSGVLVSALTFELMQEAQERGGLAYAVGGFLTGSVLYVAASYALDRLAARSPKREGRHPQDVEPNAERKPETPEKAASTGMALVVGAILDGIPENAAIGISLHEEGRAIGWVLLAAVFMGNLPESIASSVAMREEGRSSRYILALWGTAASLCTLASVAGFAVLAGLPAAWRGALLALAAGGILAMLADTMMPEAFERGGPGVALATSIGFVMAFVLRHLAFD